jgi:hypothetical protein
MAFETIVSSTILVIVTTTKMLNKNLNLFIFFSSDLEGLKIGFQIYQ